MCCKMWHVVFDEYFSLAETNMQGDSEIYQHKQEQVEQHVAFVEKSVGIQSGGAISQDSGNSEE